MFLEQYGQNVPNSEATENAVDRSLTPLVAHTSPQPQPSDRPNRSAQVASGREGPLVLPELFAHDRILAAFFGTEVRYAKRQLQSVKNRLNRRSRSKVLGNLRRSLRRSSRRRP
jgi:hypothetical protein